MWHLPKDYVPVHKRVQKAHEENNKLSIQTEHQLLWDNDTVVFKALIETEKWLFAWTSFWSIKRDKALEKLETVAVWRALAFAGYETQSWLASQEEMERFSNNNKEQEKPQFDENSFINIQKAMAEWKIDLDISFKDLLSLAKKKYEVNPDREVKLKELVS